MALQDDILLYGNRAQTKMMELTDVIEVDLRNGVANDELLIQFMNLYDVQESLFDPYCDWTDAEKARVIAFMTDLYELVEIPYTDFDIYVLPVTVPEDTANGNYVTHAELSTAINSVRGDLNDLEDRVEALENFDYSNLIPQELLDQVDENTSNIAILMDAMGDIEGAFGSLQTQLTDHINDTTKHITATERTTWNAKVDTTVFNSAMTGKANSNHSHNITDVNGLMDALNILAAEINNVMDGEDGQDGVTPAISIGTVETGDDPSVTLDPSSTPEAPIMNFVIPKGEKGEAFYFSSVDLLENRSNYDDEEPGFIFLAVDTGDYYVLGPDGWGPPIPFKGWDGWSPKLVAYTVSDSKIVWELIDWVGGTGDKPIMPYPVGIPPEEVRFFVGATGWVNDPNAAVNIKGPIGGDGEKGDPLIVNAEGTDRSIYDGSPKFFTFLNTTTGKVSSKLSDTSGDWSDYVQFVGPEGPEGPPGPPSTLHAATFTGNSTDTLFTISDDDDLAIGSVFVGGQRMREGVQYTKDDTAKTVTFVAPVSTGIGIDVEYIKALYITTGGGWSESAAGMVEKAEQAEAETANSADEADRDHVRGLTARGFRWAFDVVFSDQFNSAFYANFAGAFASEFGPAFDTAFDAVFEDAFNAEFLEVFGPSFDTAFAAAFEPAFDALFPAAFDAALAAATIPPPPLEYGLGDELSALATGLRLTVRSPFAFTLSQVRASLTTAQTSGSLLTIDVKVNGTSVFSTLLTVDNTETTSLTANTAAIISNPVIADDDVITFHITQVGDGTATGLKIKLYS